MDTLGKMKAEADANPPYKGGDIDTRTDPNLLKPELHGGFDTLCGIRGGKLSGGQK